MLEQQIDGTLPKEHVYLLGKPGASLLSAGLQDFPIKLSAERLERKASEKYKNHHPFRLESLRNLPNAMNNPIAVFDAKNENGAKVILTELTENGNNFVAAVQVRRNNGRDAMEIEVNSIRSIYSKDKKNGVLGWIDSGLMRWVNKKKALNFLSTQWPNYIAGKKEAKALNERLAGLSSASQSVQQEIDMQDLLSAINIAKGFDNPTVGGENVRYRLTEEEQGISIFIDEHINEKGNDKYDSYRYYVCGLKIDGEDYTAKIVIGVKGDSKYYDHRLTQIEKGTLINNLNAMANHVAEKQNADVSISKDTKLLSILQVNSLKDVVENGEPTIFEPTGEVDKSNGAKSDDMRYRAAEADYASVQDDASGEYAEALSAPMDISVADMMPIEAAENAQAAGLLRDVVNRFPDTKIAITDLSRVYAAAEVAEEEATEVRYRRGVNERFNEELERQIAGELPKGHVYSLGRPSEVLLAAGIPDLPIALAASRLSDKSMQDNHPYDLSEVKDLPQSIQAPMAVFRSATHIGSFVVMTEIEHRGRNFVVAIEANRKKGELK